MEEKELSLNELDNIIGGVTKEVATDKALEQPESYRQKMIDELKQEKEELTREIESKEEISNFQGRNR